ncbi:BQ2448_6485 [Microbotryum intermedium]|uniref:BQ2448_6485 protein n=1 Tax=Microbotryum intermedium TaxID=269621 RepID=A0A238FPX2_9BASI|nr:BQ2448_6485 [Microbotryum intermedium]
MTSHSSSHDALILLVLLSLFALPILLYTSSTSPNVGLFSILAHWIRDTLASLLWLVAFFVLGVGLFLCVLGGEMGHRLWMRKGRGGKEGSGGTSGGGGGGGGGGEGELIGRLGGDEGEGGRRRLRRVTREERYERKVEAIVDVLKGKRARTKVDGRRDDSASVSAGEVEMKDLSKGNETMTTTTATESKDSTIKRRMPPPPPPL